MFCFCFVINQLVNYLIHFLKFIFNDSCPTYYLKVYQTNLCQIFRLGRTMAVEITSLIPQGTLTWQPIFVGFIHRTDGCRWTQAASGAAGRANVGFALNLVVSLYLFLCIFNSWFRVVD